MGVCQRIGWTGVCQKLAPSATCDRMFMRPTNVKYALSCSLVQYRPPDDNISTLYHLRPKRGRLPQSHNAQPPRGVRDGPRGSRLAAPYIQRSRGLVGYVTCRSSGTDGPYSEYVRMTSPQRCLLW